MTGFIALFKKEVREQVRTYKLVIVGGIFLFFGITTPLLLKYLPEILRFAGEELPIQIPPPTAVQALAEFAGTAVQTGVLVAVLTTMGSVANELRHGTGIMTLSKPVSRAAFIAAKLSAASLTFLVSLAVSAAVCYAYTVWLIGSASLAAYLVLNLLLLLFLVFCLATTILFSTLFRSSLAAGGVAIAVIIAQSGLAALPSIGEYLPGKLPGWGTEVLAGRDTTHFPALAVALIAVAFCLYLSQRLLKNRDM